MKKTRRLVLNEGDIVMADFTPIDKEKKITGTITSVGNPYGTPVITGYRTPVITVMTDDGKEETFNSSFVVQILEKGHSIKKYRPSSILAAEDGKYCLSGKKNVWCGAAKELAQNVLQINHPDFILDYVKFNTLWSKNKVPGLIRRDEHTHMCYVNGKKFRKFIERNCFRIKKTVKDIRAEWAAHDKQIQQDYWDSLEEEA